MRKPAFKVTRIVLAVGQITFTKGLLIAFIAWAQPSLKGGVRCKIVYSVFQRVSKLNVGLNSSYPVSPSPCRNINCKIKGN